MPPIAYLLDILASLILLGHDCGGAVIPIGESRQPMATFNGFAGVHCTGFTMLKHVDLTTVHLSNVGLIRELGKFLRSLYPVFRQAAGT